MTWRKTGKPPNTPRTPNGINRSFGAFGVFGGSLIFSQRSRVRAPSDPKHPTPPDAADWEIVGGNASRFLVAVSGEWCCLLVRLGSRQLAPVLQHPSAPVHYPETREIPSSRIKFSGTKAPGRFPYRPGRLDPRLASRRHHSPPSLDPHSPNSVFFSVFSG
jgi:hypothetical protein